MDICPRCHAQYHPSPRERDREPYEFPPSESLGGLSCPQCGTTVFKERDLLLVNVRLARNDAVEALCKATTSAKRVEGIVLLLSTLTAGTLWFLCLSAGPTWLATSAKWAGAVFSTICAYVTAHKEKITNYRRLADEVAKQSTVLEDLIFRLRDGQSLTQIRSEYHAAKAELHRILSELHRQATKSVTYPADFEGMERHCASEAETTRRLEAERDAAQAALVSSVKRIVETSVSKPHPPAHTP